MNPVLWFSFICLFIAAVCFVADWFISLGSGAGSREVRNTEAGVKTPSPPVSDEGAGIGNGLSRVRSGGTPSSVSFKEALKPIGPAPSWAEVRRER